MIKVKPFSKNKSFFYINIFKFFKVNFLKKFFFFFKKVFKFKNFLLVETSSLFFKMFFIKISNVTIKILENGGNFYIFNNISLIKSFWRVDLMSLFKKMKKNNFYKVFKYFFFKKKIKIIFFINVYYIKLMIYLKRFNIKKIAILSKNIKNFFFDYYFNFNSIDYIKEYYINIYIFDIYINYLNTRYASLSKFFFKNNFKKLFLLK
jgi:hypothetical protein